MFGTATEPIPGSPVTTAKDDKGSAGRRVIAASSDVLPIRTPTSSLPA